jgi:hypothetical protein
MLRYINTLQKKLKILADDGLKTYIQTGDLSCHRDICESPFNEGSWVMELLAGVLAVE